MKVFYTNFSIRNYKLLSIFLLLLGSQLSMAQIVLQTDDSLNGRKNIDCSTTDIYTFMDDGTIDGLYKDSIARLDTIIFCPTDSLNNQIKVSFTDFGVASGDTLRVYDCNLLSTTCAAKATATGEGVSRAFGGWVQANCNRSVNPSGCLSFVFETNGDNGKGKGWAATISCVSDKTKITCPDDVFVADDCNNLDGMVQVTIPKPVIVACDNDPSPMVTITSSCSAITGGVVAADGGTLGTFNIPLGRHLITATSVADPSVSCTYYVTGDQPNIVCNDRVTFASNGFNCSPKIAVDDIIENPCVGTGTSYKIEIDLGEKDGGIVSAIVDGTNLTTLNAGGLDVEIIPKGCKIEYPVTITRIVKFNNCDGTGLDSLSQSCTTKVVFNEETPFVSLSNRNITTCSNLTSEEIITRLNLDLDFSCNTETQSITTGRFPGNLCTANAHVEVVVRLTSYCGITTTESFDVFITRATTFTVPRDTTFGCNDELDPADTGYPMYDTDGDGVVDAALNRIRCDFIPTYKDTMVLDATTNQPKVLRTWIIVDRCNVLDDFVLAPQTIHISGGKPVIDCPSSITSGTFGNPYRFYTKNSGCETIVHLTKPSATDECDGTITVTAVKTVDVINQTVYGATDSVFAIGKYYTQFIAKNETTQGVSDTCLVYFAVGEPGGVPAVCEDELNISFANGFATVYINNIDLTGTDNCNIYTKEIRKEGGEWGERVSLDCQEVADSTKVYLRVTDLLGQENSCWVLITANDAIVPVCEELPDLTFDCKDFDYGQFGYLTDYNNNNAFDDDEWEILLEPLASVYAEKFGNPVCGDNVSLCFEPLILQQYQLIPASCGETKIKRRYAAIDYSGNLTEFKEQIITLTYEPDFTVNFPADWEGSCMEDFPSAELDLQAKGCNILAWDYEDKRFDNVDGACFFLERTYTVLNWCKHVVGETPLALSRTEDEHGFSVDDKSVNHETLANVGSFSYTQILKITDNTEPIIIIEPVDTCLSGNECSEVRTFVISATDCIEGAELNYSYELSANSTLLKSGEGNSFTATVSNQSYEVKWQVQDNCSNTAWAIENYTFEDCKKPTAICLDGIAITIDNSSKTAVIWANDLNQKSIDNCTLEENIELRVWHSSIANEVAKPQSDDAGSIVLALPKNITLDCNFTGDQAIELYAIDEAGNWDYCTGSVEIQDPNNACNSGEGQSMAMVSGKVVNRKGVPIKGVNLLAQSSTNDDQIFQTNEAGAFELNLPIAQDYSITLDKEDLPTNGVTTFDLVLISKHILGIQPFDTPYQYLAADVNLSQSITAFDLVVLRQIILGIKPNFEDNRSWRFIEAKHEFDSNNPMSENFAESIIIPELTQDLTKMDYIALKKGDVNGNAQTDNLMAAQARNTNGDLWINLQDRFVKKGEKVEVTLLSKDIENLQGFQFALAFPNLTLDNIESGIINTKHLNQKSDNELVICWDKFSANTTISDPENLLKLYFVVQKSGQLSNLLSLSTSMNTEAIDSKDNLFNLGLNFEPIASSSSKLFQNTPNPFKENTIIGFQLAQAGPVKIEIFSLQGKQLKVIENTFDTGYNELSIHKDELNGNGVLWYRMQTLDGIYSRKMVLLR